MSTDKNSGSVKWVHPKTGKVYYKGSMPLRELKLLIPIEEFEEERKRRSSLQKKYADANRDKLREYNSKNRDRVNEYQRDYRKRNHQKVLENERKYTKENSESIRKNQIKFRETHPDRARGIKRKAENKRRATLNNCKPTDHAFLNSILESEKVCPITGSTTVDLEHIFPISKGGLGNNKGNLMWLQSNINSSKGNKNVFTWLSELTQSDLDYLMREETTSLTLEQFKDRYTAELTEQAKQLGMTYSEYKTEYNNNY